LRNGPAGILWAQWLAGPLLVALAGLLGFMLGRLLHRLLLRATKTTTVTWDDELLTRTRAPVATAVTLVCIWLALAAFDLPPKAWTFVEGTLRAALLLTFFQAILRLIDIAVVRLQQAPFTLKRPGSRALLPLGGRITKVVALVIAVVAVISSFGYPVASLLAGLGIGGLALALAAQKTFENLFGAFAVGIDQPFREGDFVKVDDFVGTVETIGLRSTRIRTLDRTVITVPNGQLAEKRIESFALRDRIRLSVTLGLVRETSSAQMRRVLTEIVAYLKAHPKIAGDSSVVARFVAFSASGLDVEVMCWFNVSNWDEFCALRSEVLLEFMAIVERAGTGFAFPTQTLHVASLPPTAAPPAPTTTKPTTTTTGAAP
jgi:MscS family membrane protein